MALFGRKIYSGFITLKDAFEEQINLKKKKNLINILIENTRMQNKKKYWLIKTQIELSKKTKSS